jgi:hypothetical protein
MSAIGMQLGIPRSSGIPKWNLTRPRRRCRTREPRRLLRAFRGCCSRTCDCASAFRSGITRAPLRWRSMSSPRGRTTRWRGSCERTAGSSRVHPLGARGGKAARPGDGRRVESEETVTHACRRSYGARPALQRCDRGRRRSAPASHSVASIAAVARPSARGCRPRRARRARACVPRRSRRPGDSSCTSPSRWRRCPCRQQSCRPR